MAPFKIGCQTYSWEMLGAEWQGTPDQILDAIASAGYAGVEFSNQMIGSYLAKPDIFGRALAQRGLAFAAFAYARTGFTDPSQEAEDLAGADEALQFVSHFDVPLCLGGPSSPDRSNREAKLDQAVRFYGEVRRRAQERGIDVLIHPHSHYTSLVLSAEEYDQLLEAVAPLGIGFNPDTGHILRGGQAVMDCLKRHRSLIRHIHIKDVDTKGNWAPLGQGITPLAEMLSWLVSEAYSGWVVIEEESGAVRPEPSAAIAVNRRTLSALHV